MPRIKGRNGSLDIDINVKPWRWGSSVTSLNKDWDLMSGLIPFSWEGKEGGNFYHRDDSFFKKDFSSPVAEKFLTFQS